MKFYFGTPDLGWRIYGFVGRNAGWFFGLSILDHARTFPDYVSVQDSDGRPVRYMRTDNIGSSAESAGDGT